MTFRIAAAAIVLTLGTFAAAAQEAATPATAEPAGKLTFQLNKAETSDGNCQVTFVVRNDTGTAIEKSVYNLAIVDSDGAVAQLVNVEFRQLTTGRQKVQTFTLRNIACENISAISINEFTECTAMGGTVSPLCESAIVETARQGMTIEFPWTL